MRIEYPNISGSGELYMDVMKAIVGPRKEVGVRNALDLMCHKAPYTSQLDFESFVFVDALFRGLDVQPNLPFTFHRTDVFDFFNEIEYHFSVSILSDAIEHLSVSDGRRLIKLMQIWSSKQIIFTPLGPQSVTYGTHPDEHKSGWYPEMLEDWACIIFPNFHPSLGCGAFFAFNCDQLSEELDRIKTELNTKSWAK